MSDTSTPNPSGGPYAAIVLGLIVIVGAIALVMNIGSKDIKNGNAKDETKAVVADNKPEEPKKEEKPAETAPVVEMKEEKPAPAPAPPKKEDETSKANGDLEVLPLELPNPAFAGTPKKIPAGTKMKPPKDREPYMGPKGLKNAALEKPVTSSDSAPLIGTLDQVTDGDKEPLDGRWVELAPGKQWVQIDLGKEYDIHVVMLWHYHLETRVYRDIVVQISNDPDFTDSVTVFNNDYDNTSGFAAGEEYEYFESFEGLLIPVKPHMGVKARYVRCYSKGSTSDDANHYTEVEVWAKEAAK